MAKSTIILIGSGKNVAVHGSKCGKKIWKFPFDLNWQKNGISSKKRKFFQTEKEKYFVIKIKFIAVLMQRKCFLENI